MTDGSLSLLRPRQSFGRIGQFSGSYKEGVSRLTGHMYSTRLDTTLVRNMLPLSTTEAPLRVLMLSPFTSDETAHAKLKIAAVKDQYVVEPEKIKGTIRFWDHVKNSAMQNIQLHDSNLAALEEIPLDKHGKKCHQTCFVYRIQQLSRKVKKNQPWKKMKETVVHHFREATKNWKMLYSCHQLLQLVH